jgi:putative hemin transport protein
MHARTDETHDPAAATDPTASAEALRRRWRALLDEQPSLSPRKAADRLGTTEAQLIATGCGDRVTRLDGGWASLLSNLEALGPVRVRTRNAAAIHEKRGVYSDVTFTDTHNMGLVLADEIDLRLFMDEWEAGFAVHAPSENAGGVEGDGARSAPPRLRFFGADGSAIHTVFLTGASSREDFQALVDAYRHDDQTPAQTVRTDPDSSEEESGAAHGEKGGIRVDEEAFLEDWEALQDTHDFFPLLNDYGLSRTRALEIGEGRFTRRVPTESLRRTLHAAAERETPIMVFVGSAGCLQIHTGPVEAVEHDAPWCRVLDPGFRLRLNEALVEQAWVVRKPTRDGDVTSLELMDADGGVIARLFGKRKTGQPEREDWRAILSALPTQGPARPGAHERGA